MLPQVTTTGLSILSEMPWGTHFCYFFETKQDLLETSVPYFRAGLENREFCLWIVYHPLTAADALQALHESIPDLDRYLAEGAIEVCIHSNPDLRGSMAEALNNVNFLHQRLEQALARGYTGMRLAGSPACMQKTDAGIFLEFERLLAASVANHRMIALCQFPLAESSAAEILDAARTHQFALARRQGDWEIVETPEIRQVKAEISKLNEQLEQGVEERTRALEAANRELHTEIARRERVEEDLRRQKEILETIFDHIPIMISIIEGIDQFKLVNREWERRLGRTLQEIRTQNIDIVAENYPNPEYRQKVMDSYRGSRGKWTDIKTRVADGRVLDLSWVAFHLSDGTSLCIGQDITERKRAEEALKESEERFRQLAENIRDLFWIKTPDLKRAIYYSPVYQKVIGRSPEEAYRDRDDRQFFLSRIVPEDRERVAEFLQRGVDAEFEIEFRITHPDGSVHWVCDRGFPIRDQSGKIYRVAGIAQDVTERKLAEEALRESEELLRQQKEILQTIFDHIPIMLGFVDRDRKLKLVNKEWERTLGWSLEEIQARNSDVLTEHYPEPEYRQNVRDFIDNSNAEWADFKTTARDGRAIDTAWVIHRLSDGGSIGIGQDITERKRAEEALRDSEERFRQLAENIRDLFWIKTPDLKRVIYFSPSYESISGQTREDAYRNPNYQGFLARIVDEDRQRIAEFMERPVEAEFEIEFRITHPDGSVHWVCDRGFPIRDQSGKIYRVAGITHDVTDSKLAEKALRESEERFRQLTENIREIFWLRSPDFKQLLYVSPMYEKISGRSCESLYAAGPESVIHPEDYTRVTEELRNLTGREFDIEYRIITKDGDVRWLRDRGFPIRNQTGEIYRIGGVAEDITDRKEAEERLKAGSEQLRALSASLQSAREQEATRIARKIHDELGGILTGLRWELEELEKMIDAADSRDLNQVMRSKLAAMLGLTDTTINAVRRIASELRPSILDDLGLVEAIEWQAEQFQARTGIQCACHSSTPSIALGNQESTALFRIVQEALTNILRHAQATRVEVVLSVKDGMLDLTVADNGRGITEADRLSRKSLGLLGMQERAHLIGGQWEITGRPGAGTTLQVRVPLAGAGPGGTV